MFEPSPFLKKKVAGLEFIMSPSVALRTSSAEGLPSFLKRKGFTLQSLRRKIKL